ncbi:pectate lyase [Arvimicrobium flavum]|uniref:pectate lyase n=1 Tax=Arvimicrobium flavum TaxID=3393320 RepID=UPI00237B553A|nr:pectate lyase [Mesorhizobium shangrilense]
MLTLACCLGVAVGASPSGESSAAPQSDDDLLAAAVRVAGLFAHHLAAGGGYVWAYSPDLVTRRGEGGEVEPGVILNQPPGTPAVGAAFIRLFELTGDPQWMTAADAAAQAAVNTQLVSGGWYNSADTEPNARQKWCYRVRVDKDQCDLIEGNKQRNHSTLDDNITQSTLGFLLWYDAISKGRNPAVARAIDYGLDRLLTAQYANGAWPVKLERVYPPRLFAAAWRARLPANWPREWVKPPNPTLILNDHVMRDMMSLLLAADRHVERDDLLPAARRSGDFLLAAQLPAPQSGWAQSYNLDLEPIWGRKFEPPAVASDETTGAINALLQIYLKTGEKRYLAGALDGAKWLELSRRPTGDWARFYELGSNRPLYVTEENRLTYDEDNLRKGYTFASDFNIPATLQLVERVARGERPEEFDNWDWVVGLGHHNLDAARAKIRQADPQGKIVEDGWIQSSTFVEGVWSLGEPLHE